MTARTKKSFLREHSLSLVSAGVLIAWIIFYARSNPHTHWGSFFGNAIADWSGLLVTVLATKFLYEINSAESRKPPQHWMGTVKQVLEDHSLTIFLALTGVGWIWLFAISDPDSKWGQVVGNIVSEWTQIFGLVLLTKKLVEANSKESRQ
jgi:ABC-type Co2+ transport system permease subunit